MKTIVEREVLLVGGRSDCSIPGACDSCIYTGQRKEEGGRVKDPEKWNNSTPGTEGRTWLWQRSWEGCGMFLGRKGRCVDSCFTSCSGWLLHNSASLDVKAGSSVYY